MSRRLVDGTMPVPGPNAKRAGRPKRIDIEPGLIQRLRNAILMGAPVLTAAALNDISYETMRSWVIKGKERPDSEYGALLSIISKAIAEWEIRDLAVLDAHATGRPARYAMQPVINSDGIVVKGNDGKPLMEYVKDSEGNLIIESSEIKSDWRAAMERLARRKPRSWGPRLSLDMDAVLTFDNKEKEVNPKEAMTFEKRIAEAVRELEDEV